jgi:hypothetical protein
MDYAFRVFCAVQGFRAVPEGGDAGLCYGAPPGRPGEVGLAAGYGLRPASVPAPLPRLQARNALFPAGIAPRPYPEFHPREDGAPDWLGEAFEWLSMAHEGSSTERDAVGRIPDESTLPFWAGLDPKVPYAALAFRGLARDLAAGLGSSWDRPPLPPFRNGRGFGVAATHDLDYLPLGLADALSRLAKNCAIALLHDRDPRCAAGIALRGCRTMAAGRLPFDAVVAIARRERRAGISASYNVLCGRAHRRDGNYDPAGTRETQVLARVMEEGMELGVHGSYTSLARPGGLGAEYDRLEQATGHRPLGGRQHWLRFHGDELFQALVRAGAGYDCSVGFSRHTGFRTGANFPYPPYDFSREQPFPLVEFPLAVMDIALRQEAGQPGRAQALCADLMTLARGWGWGGISVLWHDTVLSGLQIAQEIGDLYWSLPEPEDCWRSCAELLEAVRPRFAAAGLPLAGTARNGAIS